MRIFAGLTLACALAALLCARYLETGFAWYVSLYALPLAATLFAVALTSAVFEYVLGAAFRPISAALAFALMLFAVLFAAFEGAPGVLPETELLLSDLPQKAMSICALGAAAGALVLAVYALRSPLIVPQMAACLTLGGGLYVARQTAVGFGLPFLSAWSTGLVAASLVVFAFTAGMRRRSRGAAEPEDEAADPPPPESS
ncbi:MAG TPA: hypothetical protein VGK67_10295 [Myxococcales bacterium]|jgi:hypothetical protein